MRLPALIAALLVVVPTASCMRARRDVSEICRAPADGALLCIFQASDKGWTDIVVDGKTVGGLDNGEWLEITVEPGSHVARAAMPGGERSGPVDVNLRLGDAQALEVSRGRPGRHRVDVELDETRIEEARERIRSDCKPNAPISLRGAASKPEP